MNISSGVQIYFDKKLGSGADGDVYKGIYDGVLVAIKTTKKDENDLINEWKIGSIVSHPQIITLYGIYKDDNISYLVTEFMNKGSLDDYLMKQKPSEFIIWEAITNITNAIKRLSDCNIVHGDLAARNILLAERDDRFVFKLADFGRAFSLQKGESIKLNGSVPDRWVAPEVLFNGTFSHNSDIYSLATLFWEILSYGEEPWHEFKSFNLRRALYNEISNINGKRLKKPELCSDDFYSLMLSCWNPNPSERPSFDEIIKQIEFNKPGVYNMPLEQFSNSFQPSSVNSEVKTQSSPIPSSSIPSYIQPISQSSPGVLQQQVNQVNTPTYGISNNTTPVYTTQPNPVNTTNKPTNTTPIYATQPNPQTNIKKTSTKSTRTSKKSQPRTKPPPKKGSLRAGLKSSETEYKPKNPFGKFKKKGK